jgi:hypothetical protein
VQAELHEEQKIVEQQLRFWPLDRLQSEGLVLMGMKVSGMKGNLFKKDILALTSEKGGPLPYYRFA